MAPGDSPANLERLLLAALPGRLARRLPPRRLRAAWRELVGEVLASRTLPICLEDDGCLVVAVSGSVWRQELSFLAPQLVQGLGERGFAVERIRLVARRTPYEPPPPPPPPPLEPEEEQEIAGRAAQVRDPELRRALERLMRAERRARKASDR